MTDKTAPEQASVPYQRSKHIDWSHLTAPEQEAPPNCQFCGGPQSLNPHPKAGDPSLGFGYQFHCIPCLLKSRTEWTTRAYKAEADLRGALAVEQEAPLTDELRQAANRVVFQGLTFDRRLIPSDGLHRALLDLRAALAPQPKGTRPLTEPVATYYVTKISDTTTRRHLAWRPGCEPSEFGEYALYLSAPRPLVAEPPDSVIAEKLEGLADLLQSYSGMFIASAVADPAAENCRLAAARLSPAPSITPEPEMVGVVCRLSVAGYPMRDGTGVEWHKPVPAGSRLYVYPPAPDASSTVAPPESRVESELHRQLQDDLNHPISTSSAPSSSGGPSGLA